MKSRTLLALLVILGACKADHTLGSVGLDSGADQMNADTGAPTYADAQISASPETGGTAEVPPNGGLDAGASGTLGPVQSWTGWVENYQFPSGSDVIKFSFASDSAGQVVGQVVFGVGTPPPPATDPNVGYPDENDTGAYTQMEGFPYSMVTTSYTPSRLRFTIQENEPWTGWCALQTPMFDGDTTCLPAWNGMLDPNNNYCALFNPNGETLVVDCGKFNLCPRVCICSAASCRVKLPEDTTSPFDPSPAARTVSFDLALSGSIGSGSVVGGMDDHNVHFTKDP